MKIKQSKKYSFMCFVVLLISVKIMAQNLEVEGQAKITVMNTDNNANEVVVRQADGTLAVRAASTISAQNNTSVYGTVTNPATGKVWLDRNLGASQVATSPTDFLSFGDYYQWGRAADGHQKSVSPPVAAQVSDWMANTLGSTAGHFITINSSTRSDWIFNGGYNDMWSGRSAENNPCPSGFRIPTNAEWVQEILTWTSNDATGAFSSTLKLPSSGFRGGSVTPGTFPTITYFGVSGYYWSSTASYPHLNDWDEARYLFFTNGNNPLATTGNLSRVNGLPCRCIKD